MTKGRGRTGLAVAMVVIGIVFVAYGGLAYVGVAPGGIVSQGPCATVNPAMTASYSPANALIYANDTSTYTNPTCPGQTGNTVQYNDTISVTIGSSTTYHIATTPNGGWGQKVTQSVSGVAAGTSVSVTDIAILQQIVSGYTYYPTGAVGTSYVIGSAVTNPGSCGAPGQPTCVSGSLTAAFTGTASGLVVTVTDASVVGSGATFVSATINWGDGTTPSSVAYHGTVSHTYSGAQTVNIVETVTWSLTVASLGGAKGTSQGSASITLPGDFSFSSVCSSNSGCTTSTSAAGVALASLCFGVVVLIGGIVAARRAGAGALVGVVAVALGIVTYILVAG